MVAHASPHHRAQRPLGGRSYTRHGAAREADYRQGNEACRGDTAGRIILDFCDACLVPPDLGSFRGDGL